MENQLFSVIVPCTFSFFKMVKNFVVFTCTHVCKLVQDIDYFLNAFVQLRWEQKINFIRETVSRILLIFFLVKNE